MKLDNVTIGSLVFIVASLPFWTFFILKYYTEFWDFSELAFKRILLTFALILNLAATWPLHLLGFAFYYHHRKKVGAR